MKYPTSWVLPSGFRLDPRFWPIPEQIYLAPKWLYSNVSCCNPGAPAWTGSKSEMHIKGLLADWTTDTSKKLPLFIINKHAFYVVPIAQPHSQDTCGIGSGPFSALGWPEGWFGIDWVEMKWSPPHRLHLDIFCHSFPQNLPSLPSSSPQTAHISWLLPRMGGTGLVSVLHVAGCPSPSHRQGHHCCRRWLVLILAGAVCVVWDFFLVQVYARVDLYLFSTVT